MVKVMGIVNVTPDSFSDGGRYLDPEAGLEATPKDVTKNEHKIEFVEMEAAALPTVLADVDRAVLEEIIRRTYDAADHDGFGHGC